MQSVRLYFIVSMARQKFEGGALFTRRHMMDLTKRPLVESAAHLHREIMSKPRIVVATCFDERDGFLDDVVGGEPKLSQVAILVFTHYREDSDVVLVPLVDEREKEARIEKDQRGRRSP